MAPALFTLGFKSILGDRLTSGQPRDIVIYTCVYHASPRCPADYLGSDFITADVNFLVMSLSGMHQHALTFPLQKVVKCIPDHFGKWFE